MGMELVTALRWAIRAVSTQVEVVIVLQEATICPIPETRVLSRRNGEIEYASSASFGRGLDIAIDSY